MQIEPWQIPVLVTAGTVVLAFPIEAIAKRVSKRGRAALLATKRVRTLALALLAALILVIFVWAVGTSTADRLATVASVVIETLALWLTYLSYQEQKRAERSAETVKEAPKVPPNP
jgi:predicted PurR-regulated permease PerM